MRRAPSTCGGLSLQRCDRRVPHRPVIAREGAVSGTPRLLGSITAASGILDLPLSRTMTAESKRARTFSRRAASELCVTFGPPREEGAGKAGCTLHPRSRVQSAQGKRTRAYRFSGGIPAFPARWFTAYFGLSPVTGLLPPSSLRSLLLAKLSASTGAPGPHDFAVREHLAFVFASAASTASHRAFVTLRNAPLIGRDGAS
jgi:hypothetical protein